MFRSKRLYINILVFGLFFFTPITPWYVLFAIGAYVSWLFPYYEFMLLGFLMDVTYSSGHFFAIFGHPFPLPMTVSAAILVIALQAIKKKVRFYA